MALRRLPVVIVVLVGCLLLAAPVRAQCSDCFVPYMDVAVQEEQSRAEEPTNSRRIRAQAGDVTAVSVSFLVDELPSHVPLVLSHALLVADSARTVAQANLSEVFSAEGLSSLQADSLASAATGLLGTPLTAIRLARVTATYEGVREALPEPSSENSYRTFEGLGDVLAMLTDSLSDLRDASAVGESSIQVPTGAVSRLVVDATDRRGHPSSTISTPTAFGPGWGQVFAGVSYQNRIRYSDWQDGILVFGGGIGNPSRTVGLSMVVRLLDTYTEFAKDRSLSVTLHRRGPYRTAVAVGYENLWHTGGTDGGRSRFVVLSTVLPLRSDLSAPLGSVVISGGVGTDRFLSEPRFARGEDGLSPFGSVGVRLIRTVNGIVNWSGQDLNLGLSIAPHRKLPFVITPALLDVTGSAGDGARWAVSASVGYNARR